MVQAAICGWDVPVDIPVAILLTSELVTNAVRHGAGKTVRLVITCPARRLRVDVHDDSRAMPVPADAPADAEAGRGLLLVASLSADWGCYRTLTGKAVYFTLAFEADPDQADPDQADRQDLSRRPARRTALGPGRAHSVSRAARTS